MINILHFLFDNSNHFIKLLIVILFLRSGSKEAKDNGKN